MNERIEVMWCTACGARFTEAEIKGWGCPKCGNQGAPCGCAGDVLVEINWHELHILCVWAENWAAEAKWRAADADYSQMPNVVAAIARRLQLQFPELGHLTLSGEIAMLPSDAAKIGLNVSGVSSNIERPPLVPVHGPGAVGHGRPRERKAG